MKVAFVLLDGEVTGGQLVAFELMNGLRARGHEAVAVFGADGEMVGRVREDGFETHVVPLRHAYRVDDAWRLARLLRRAGGDVVDTHTLFAGNQLSRVAAALARVPLVCHVHIDERFHGNRRISSLQRVCDAVTRRRCVRIVAVSSHLRAHAIALGADPQRVVVVHNGVAPEGPATPPPPRHGLALACVARLAPVKGQEVLLRALRQVDESVTVALAGRDLEQGGRYLERLEALARELGIERRVRFLGHVADVRALLRSSDGLVLPSFAEGLPMTVLEAMAQGRAVVATDVGGTGEAVEHGVTGLLVPPGDEDALAAALAQLLASQELRAAYGAAGRARVAAEFTIEQMVERTLEAYRDAIRSTSSSAASRSRGPTGSRRSDRDAASPPRAPR